LCFYRFYSSLYPLYLRRCTILLATSASNICRHLLLTALNLNSQHRNGSSIWAKHLKHLSQHLNGPSICSSIWASISANIGQHCGVGAGSLAALGL
jgi:hypothetical protein